MRYLPPVPASAVRGLLSRSADACRAIPDLVRAVYAKRMLLAEILGAVAVWRGMADYSLPASLIVIGVAVIGGIEYRAMLTEKA